MPLASRREEIGRFLSGAAEVCASTDVLGHGVNLPCETLLFAETEKFDGKERRDLEPWEIAQIAGRAGRFGFHERGHVGVLTGLPWADPDPELVRDALTPHVELPGGHLGYRVVDTGRLRPQLSDLNVTRVDDLEPALHAWRDAALRFWSVDGWLAVESIAAAPRAARCGARGVASRAPPARARGRVEAHAGADRRGRARAARDARVRARRRHAAAHGDRLAARPGAA